MTGAKVSRVKDGVQGVEGNFFTGYRRLRIYAINKQASLCLPPASYSANI